jgi:hypothetical protein
MTAPAWSGSGAIASRAESGAPAAASGDGGQHRAQRRRQSGETRLDSRPDRLLHGGGWIVTVGAERRQH